MKFNSLDSLLHVASQNYVSVRVRPRDNICFVVLAVSHHVILDMLRFGEQDLSSGWVAV